MIRGALFKLVYEPSDILLTCTSTCFCFFFQGRLFWVLRLISLFFEVDFLFLEVDFRAFKVDFGLSEGQTP